MSGTVQLPPDGNPLILLAEHQTTGGYKVPAVVIQADMWQVGQMLPGDSLRFVQTSAEEATAALQQLHAQARETQPRPIDVAELDLRTLASGVNQMGPGMFRDKERSDGGGHTGSQRSSAAYALSPRSGADARRIDLNADSGEGFDDAGLLRYVTSVNISCGGHVGTPESIAEVVAMAADRGAGIGAHVSFVDREGPHSPHHRPALPAVALHHTNARQALGGARSTRHRGSYATTCSGRRAHSTGCAAAPARGSATSSRTARCTTP